MASLVDKIKGTVAPLKDGAEVPAGHLVKEDNPEQPSVDLGKLTGKSEFALDMTWTEQDATVY